jgi:hypothetical protein
MRRACRPNGRTGLFEQTRILQDCVKMNFDFQNSP